MASLRDRLRAAAGVPAPRTTPSTLRALLRRRRRRRRTAAMTLSAVVVTGVVTGVAVLVRSQRPVAIKFAEAPMTATEASTTTRAGSELEPEPEPQPQPEHRESPAAPLPRPAPPDNSSQPAPEADRPAPVPATPACEGSRDVDDVPAGAASKQIVDVDGDDRPDVMWLDQNRTLGIITAAGGSATLEVESQRPNRIAALAADADRRAPVELLVSDGRSTQLFVFDECKIRPVINTENGQPWSFARPGTGVACVEIDGQRRLVGLNSAKHGNGTVEWSRTVVDLEVRSATTGRKDKGSFDSAGRDDAVEQLSQITCGDLTMVDDGVQTPAPQ